MYRQESNKASPWRWKYKARMAVEQSMYRLVDLTEELAVTAKVTDKIFQNIQFLHRVRAVRASLLREVYVELR